MLLYYIPIMRWKILKKIQNSKSKIQNEEVIRILLENRGLKTRKEQEEFLHPPKPQDLTAKEVGISSVELKKAIARIKKAIKTKEKIIIYGDYDTDGVCGTAILWEVIYKLGGEVMPFIPKRKEGYGMKVARLEEMAKEGVKLVITVDQGIVAVGQAERAKDLGMDLIITDHHLPGEKKPKALAILHTTKLSGAGVAWFLAKNLGDGTGLDLATIGTVSDVVPLIGPNRSIVKYGLEAVRRTKRVGLISLYQTAGISPENIGTYEISFIIGPRLNASGRMDDPLDSLRLICTKDKQRALDLAQKIEEKNRQRQDLTQQTLIHARNLWLASDGKSSLIFVQDKSYEEGVIGLVAGKLMEEFYRPAVVLAPRENHWVASARSIEEFNIVEAIRTCAEFLGPHGGHRKAAGFTIEESKISLVRQRLIELAHQKLGEENLKPTLIIDTELSLGNLSLSLYDQLISLSPFGEGNPQPVFATRNVQILDAQLVGAESRHLKLQLVDNTSGTALEAIGFGLGDFFFQLSPEQPVDIAYNLATDEWNGKRKIQLKLKDIKIKNE
jgi:single-stranded-DNA-specific exonuclease